MWAGYRTYIRAALCRLEWMITASFEGLALSFRERLERLSALRRCCWPIRILNQRCLSDERDNNELQPDQRASR
jgi:hypothetical protein